MLYISKKKIYFWVFILLIFSVSCIYEISMQKEESIATVSLPVSNKTVVLDAGHGTPDEG